MSANSWTQVFVGRDFWTMLNDSVAIQWRVQPAQAGSSVSPHAINIVKGGGGNTPLIVTQPCIADLGEATGDRWSRTAGYGAHVFFHLLPPPADFYPQPSAKNRAETAAPSQPPNRYWREILCCYVPVLKTPVADMIPEDMWRVL